MIENMIELNEDNSNRTEQRDVRLVNRMKIIIDEESIDDLNERFWTCAFSLTLLSLRCEAAL